MKVVIDIPEEVYKTVQDGTYCGTLYEELRNGTPLLKGHGRLVDFSEVLIKLMQFYDGDKTIGQCLDEVNTIIEADKEERSDK